MHEKDSLDHGRRKRRTFLAKKQKAHEVLAYLRRWVWLTLAIRN